MITLSNLAEATAQEVFNQVAKHLITQGEKSLRYLDDRHKCAYRSDDGLACAAGCLMSDTEYSELLENFSWTVLVIQGSVPREHCNLIEDLQQIHDGYATKLWDSELRKLAKRYEFNTEVLDNAA